MGSCFFLVRLADILNALVTWIDQSMEKIEKYFKNQSSPLFLRPGQRMMGNVNNEYQCYFIESGLAVVYISDITKPRAVVTGTQIVGLSYLFCPQEDFTLKMIHASVVYVLPASVLLSIINESCLWPEVAYALAEECHELSHNGQRTKNSRVEELIPKTLQMLQNESEEVRLTHTVNDYVCNITGLSQSTVKRSLNALKKQGYIDVQNGLLLRCKVE